ncbi:thioredoxin domain-containing protein 16 [Thalassophryne amazonica]|uniref:thioredoxin domain-containing protein 16 n=1 Tax=Thalassophryne amazonica TaxID=390379 RepID=UPI001470AD98|nr:thioredoxin domain-containing protein 16 [Thalassophryne amazonica]
MLMMRWHYFAVFLLWMSLGGSKEMENASHILELSAAQFRENLEAGKSMVVFFWYQEATTINLFLVQLEKSAEPLHDFGILVGMVNCPKEKVAKYCTSSKTELYLFRKDKKESSFSLKLVFDVDAIVSHVLFDIVYEEIHSVDLPDDLTDLEKKVKGNTDIVLALIKTLGTAEHRSVMETAFVYGSKYQFALSVRGGEALKALGVNPTSRSSGVWFLHCKAHKGFMQPITADRCPVTAMRKPLTTLGLHSFLQLMEAPLVSEVHEDPSSVQPPPPPNHHTPQIFLFSRPGTEHLDLNTAITLAWRLRGVALLVLVHRESPAVKTPNQYNVAYRKPQESSEVKYLTLHKLEEILELFPQLESEEEEAFKEEETEEKQDDDGVLEDIEWRHSLDELDDEIAKAMYEKRDTLRDIDMGGITQMTSENFHTAIVQSDLTVVLFYLKWDAVSMAFLSSFMEVAETLADSKVTDVQMVGVDCGVWTDLCAAQTRGLLPIPFEPITSFPTVLLLRPQESAVHYSGMLGSKALHCFILLSRLASPALLITQKDVTSFLEDTSFPELARCKPNRVLGLFKTHTHTGVPVFTEAAKSLRGEMLSGLLTDGLAEKWAADYRVVLPAVLVFPSWRTQTHPSPLNVSSSAEELLTNIRKSHLRTLPELTVENLPSYLAQGKALLLLFIGEEENKEENKTGRSQNKALVEEMRRVVESGGEWMEQYLACWMHLGRTPAGKSILVSYLGSQHSLPALILTHLPSRADVYQYPPNSPIVGHSIRQWLQRIEGGTEPPAGALGEDLWPPALQLFDFLSIIDKNEPESTQQKTPDTKDEEYYQEFGYYSGQHLEDEGSDSEEEEEKGDSLVRSPNHIQHTEL